MFLDRLELHIFISFLSSDLIEDIIDSYTESVILNNEIIIIEAKM